MYLFDIRIKHVFLCIKHDLLGPEGDGDVETWSLPLFSHMQIICLSYAMAHLSLQLGSMGTITVYPACTPSSSP